jgi:endoglycosylceramidase
MAAAPPSDAAGVGNIDGFVTVAGTQFLDGAGKPLLLHGINVVNKSQAEGYTKNIEQSDFAAIRGWGMNCVRLGILWDGLEPLPGQINDEYLDRIARIIGWAKAEGLYVLLDMHQDLFSVKFSDGAPAWATLDEGKPYTPTAVWSDAYFTSEAVQAALDHFWANSPGPDGVGLQDHYARVWQRVADRFRDEPAVAGYDLMNEPYPGRDNARNRLAMFNKLVELLPAKLGDKMPSPAQLAKVADTADGRKHLADWLGDTELFSAMLDAGTPIMQAFERERLQPMYGRVRKAIRQVDERHIIFLEPATSANIGIPSAIAPLVDEHGRRDPRQAYAPHAYDIVTDTPQSGRGSSDARIELIFRRHAKKARELTMPLLIGEWGAYYEDPNAVGAARFVVKQMDALQCGDTYWDYQRKLHKSPLLPALARHLENRTEQ